MKNNEYKYFGPHGPLLLMIALPLLVLTLVKATEFYRDPNFTDKDLSLEKIWNSLIGEQIFNLPAFTSLVGWILIQGIFYKLLPGEEVLALPSNNSKSLPYTLNGLSSFLSTTFAIAAIYMLQGNILFLWVADNLWPLCKSGALLSLLLSIFVYVYSYRKNTTIIKSNDTKFFIYDFWMGRELNPRVFNVDLKHFFYTRVGLLGILFLSFCILIKHIDVINEVGNSQLFIFISLALYVSNSLYNESSLLTTSYVTKEGFGYMLCLESILIMPFLHTIQANYLITREVHMPTLSYYLIALLNLIGLYVMQSSNNQKEYFNRSLVSGNKMIEPSNYRIAKDGKPILFTGWWGLARHINYTGCMLMFLTISLLTKFSSIIPYTNCIYLMLVFIDRHRREESYCKNKKGSVWREYCRTVPWKFVPYIV